MTGSPRLIEDNHLKMINKNRISFTGNIGTTIVANTSGFHRKGMDFSGKERRMIFFEFKRLGILQRIFRSFL